LANLTFTRPANRSIGWAGHWCDNRTGVRDEQHVNRRVREQVRQLPI